MTKKQEKSTRIFAFSTKRAVESEAENDRHIKAEIRSQLK
jgi:hypothetical protein